MAFHPPSNKPEPEPQSIHAPASGPQPESLIPRDQAVPSVETNEEHEILIENEDDARALYGQGDEEQWDLDDAQDEQRGRQASPEDEPVEDVTQLADDFMRSHPPLSYTGSTATAPGALPYPVIIPQRRPGNKHRGFVRAYAPVLENCGIDQATFLDFLKAFHKGSQASKWLDVVNIAAVGAGFVPNGIAVGVSIAAQVTVHIAMEAQSKWKRVTPSFLLFCHGRSIAATKKTPTKVKMFC